MATLPFSRSIFVTRQTCPHQTSSLPLRLSRPISSTSLRLQPSQVQEQPSTSSTFRAAAPPARLRKNETRPRETYSRTQTDTILPPLERPNQPFSAVAPFLARQIPSDTATQPRILPQSDQAQAPPKPSFKFPKLPYHVHRTISQQLPVYHVTKGGGTKKLTQIRRITGNANKLRDQLEENLPVTSTGKRAGVSVNPLTGHVWVKGWKKGEVAQFLRSQYF